MATPSLNPSMNLPPLPEPALSLPPSSSPPSPAVTEARDQSAAASENQDPLLRPSSASGETVVPVKEVEDGEQRSEKDKSNEQWPKEMQGWLVVLATLVASVTYSAGVNVPGGFWQDDSPANITTKGHTAGNPVLADKSPSRYRVFFAFNASAFVTSMAVIVLLLKRSFFHSEVRLSFLLGCLLESLISLVVAFCAVSTRNLADVLSLVIMVVFGFSLLRLYRSYVIKRYHRHRGQCRASGGMLEFGTMGQQP